MNRLLVLPITVYIMQLLDILTTFLGVNYLGLTEFNPFYSPVLILFKIIYPSFLLPLCYSTNKLVKINLVVFSATIITMYSYVLANNISLILGVIL